MRAKIDKTTLYDRALVMVKAKIEKNTNVVELLLEQGQK